MENSEISQLAAVLHATPKSDGIIFSISTKLLRTLNAQFEAHIEQSEPLTTSFNTIAGSNILKNDFFQDLQYVYNYIKHTKTLKLFDDDESKITMDISRFKNIKLLELYKVDINSIRGLQKLRSQLQTLICSRSNGTLSDLLMHCGGDKCTTFSWTELKEVSFINNGLKEIDASFESIPWAHTIDLSHNELTTVENLNLLNNLKILNLAYNRLEAMPPFKGPGWAHLQNLVVKNNFIDNINGLQSLTNLCVLDLSNNCLIDHTCLIPLSHLVNLQWLNLTGNPLYFHPRHRDLTARYLHNNIKNAPFVLNGTPLGKMERRYIGTLHPMQLKMSSSFSNNSINVSNEPPRRVRHVIIEDASSPKTIIEPLSMPQYHLDAKRQIEDLREQYGESWLNSGSGLVVQNVLGLVSSSRSTPCDGYLSPVGNDSLGSSPQLPNLSLEKEPEEQQIVEPTNGEISFDQADETKTSFFTAYDSTIKEDDSSEISGDDLELEGDENIYLVLPEEETDQIMLVMTKMHICERIALTGKERLRWHIKSVIKCERIDDTLKVLLEFDTMKKFKKQRIYEFEEQDIDKFVKALQEQVASRVVEKTHTNYQCMKCSTKFSKDKRSRSESPIVCPKCDGKIIIEDL